MPASARSTRRPREAAPGVLAVLTAADVAADGLKSLRPYAEANVQTGERFMFDEQPLLAADKVRFIGETVAMVVAETLAQALDASELIAVDYEPLPAVTTAYAAVAPDAPLLSPEVPGNICMDWRTGDAEGAEAAFARAAHVVSLGARQPPRHDQPDRAARLGRHVRSGERPLHAPHLEPEHPRQPQPRRPRLGVEPKDVRFIAPDVGGGFGAKNFIYVEHVLVAWAARKVGRPVKWIATRSEVFLADHPSRDMQAEASLALDADGQVPRAQGRERRQCRRLSRRRRRRRADLSVRPPAGHGLSPALDRAACAGGAEQHHADRRDARAGLRRDGQHPRAADRCGGAAVRLRPRRAAPPQHGAGARDADDQRLRLPGRQRRLSRDDGQGAGARRHRGLRRAAPAERGARPAGAAWASPITSRVPAARRRRMSTSASSPTAPSR